MQGSGKNWQQTNPNYASMDAGPQTFFYTISNMLKLNEAKNIIEIGCGAGKLISTILDLKSLQTNYYATDLSESMVNQSKKRLQIHFKKYQSKITFEEWLQKNHLKFEVQNGEDIKLNDNLLFDRIIANMVLCHADDPEKMLKNWYSVSTDNCLIGISLLGDPTKNFHVNAIRDSIKQAGEKESQDRPPYYWFDKIRKIVESTGWQIILEWQQNSLFPCICVQQLCSFKQMIQKRLPSQKARNIYMQKLRKRMTEQKKGIQFWCKAIIARKKIK